MTGTPAGTPGGDNTATPGPGIVACPVEGAICQFADHLQESLEAGDVQPLIADAVYAEVDCEDVPAGCASGDTVTGLPIGKFGGEAAVLDEEELGKYLGSAFQLPLELLSVGCEYEVPCDQAFALTFEDAAEAVAILRFVAGGDTPRLIAVYNWRLGGPVMEGGEEAIGVFFTGRTGSMQFYAFAGVTSDQFNQLPRPTVRINGILIGEGVAVGGWPFCSTNEGYGVSAAEAAGTRVALAARAYPAGWRQLSSEATRCDESILGASLSVAASQDGTSSTINVFRSLAPYPTVGTATPAQYWRAIRIGGLYGAIANPVVDGRLYTELAVWDPEGVETYIHAARVSPDAVVAFARGLFPPDSGEIGPDDPALPGDTRTGIELVDTVIEAAVDRNLGQLQALVRPTDIPCSDTVHADLKPGCTFGNAEGTPLAVLPVFNCEGFLVPGEIAGQAVQLLSAMHARLYGAFRTGGVAHWPAEVATEFGVVFVGDPDIARSVLVGVGDGGIVGLSFGCGLTNPAEYLEGIPVADWLLTPAR